MQQQLVQESAVENVLKNGVLKVGMSTFVPWAMKDKTGKLIGFEIDVATQLAKDMGVNVEFVPTAWSGIIPALLTGKFDVIIGGMGITAQLLADQGLRVFPENRLEEADRYLRSLNESARSGVGERDEGEVPVALVPVEAVAVDELAADLQAVIVGFRVRRPPTGLAHQCDGGDTTRPLRRDQCRQLLQCPAGVDDRVTGPGADSYS